MTFQDFQDKVLLLFSQESGEIDEAYQFFINEATDQFRHHGNLERAWDQIREYDGNTKRPKLRFFNAIAAGTKVSHVAATVYYQCSCGQKLSENSAGGCPVCHRSGAEMVFSKKQLHVLGAQAACFDCSAYSEFALGPSCQQFGTPARLDCNDKSRCGCERCCHFEFMRAYRPGPFRDQYHEIRKALPEPLSEAGIAFHQGRASVVDINRMLEWKKKQAEAPKKEFS